MGFDGFQIFFHRVVNSDIKHLKTSSLKHHPNEILSDVMDIPFHGADYDTADRFRPGFRQQGSEDTHTTLHRVGRHQNFWDKKDAVAKINTDDPHPLHECLREHFIGRPTPLQQDIGSFYDLFFQSIIEVIVHLLDKLLIGEGA